MKFDKNRQMTVEEYRHKHPHCKFCKHKTEQLVCGGYCRAKEKSYFFNKAKECSLYEQREYKRSI